MKLYLHPDPSKPIKMKVKVLERVAAIGSGLILLLALWFWSEQIQDVLELLEMAYG